MMDLSGPCQPTPSWVYALNVSLNTFQMIVLAYLAQRAARKNREELEAKTERNMEP